MKIIFDYEKDDKEVWRVKVKPSDLFALEQQDYEIAGILLKRIEAYGKEEKINANPCKQGDLTVIEEKMWHHVIARIKDDQFDISPKFIEAIEKALEGRKNKSRL